MHQCAQGLLIIKAPLSHSDTPHLVILFCTSDQPKRPLADNTHKKQTSMSPEGLKTHNPRKQEAANPCFRPRGHYDQQKIMILWWNTCAKLRRDAWSFISSKPLCNITCDFPGKRLIPTWPDNCRSVVLVTSICVGFILSHIAVFVASGFPAFRGVLLTLDVLFTTEGGVLLTALTFSIPDIDPLLVFDTFGCCSLWIGWFGSARSNSGWITSDWKTEFFCQRFSTRITLLWKAKKVVPVQIYDTYLTWKSLIYISTLCTHYKAIF